ncbi:MAG: PEP/pyruvate-binding domain-containing protein [Cytophagaceae bacterium]
MHFITCAESDKAKNFSIGGKANNLFTLQRSGVTVPHWLVIPAECYNELFSSSHERETIISSFRFPQEFLTSVNSFFPHSARLAVRSSAVGEDSTDYSFAGQFESLLNVSKENLESAIKKVWNSYHSARTEIYKQQKGASVSGMAVIIQEMIEADVSGVAFSVNPVTGDRKEVLINAVYGLGEGLVSGKLNADMFTYKSGIIQSQAVEKTTKFVHDTTADGLKEVEVESSNRNIVCLDNNQIREIEIILRKLEKLTGKPQDIEFAVKNGQLFLLQTRPITTLAILPDKSEQRVVWDNSNIIESYPGMVSPLTFSFIIKVYEAVYRQFMYMVGVEEKVIEDHSEDFANMLGIIHGRVYYNLLSWYKLLSLLPGYNLNAEFMETMMGVKEKFDLDKKEKVNKWSEYFRIVKLAFNLISSFRSLPKEREKFIKLFSEVHDKFVHLNYDEKSAPELMSLYLEFESLLLKEWKPPITNDFFAMIFFGLLKKQTEKWIGDSNPNLHNDLLCNSGDIISVEPVRRGILIANEIASDPEASIYFLNNSEEEIWDSLCLGKYVSYKKMIDAYIHDFGDRCVGELKLETISYKQQPSLFVKIIKTYIKNKVKISEKNIEEQIRKSAEDKVKEKLGGKIFRKIIFNYSLKSARSLVSNRENLRYERTKAFGIVRRIFNAIGKRFYYEGLINDARDIFYLRKEEIFGFIKGTSSDKDLKSLIDLRKAEYRQFEKVPAHERFSTYGIVNHANQYTPDSAPAFETSDLKGIGCCPGIIKGKVKIVREPNEISSLDGDILVTVSTDPGWVTLFPTASAILVERGSLLSHSAIVSREMGIPCIVGITGLLQILKTGDEVEMNGSTGEIRVLKS